MEQFIQVDLESDPICNSTGCTQYKFPEDKEDFPKDYHVNDWGMDADVKITLENEALATKMIGKRWMMGTEKHAEEYKNKALDTLYNFEPELEDEIKSSMRHQAKAED